MCRYKEKQQSSLSSSSASFVCVLVLLLALFFIICLVKHALSTPPTPSTFPFYPSLSSSSSSSSYSPFTPYSAYSPFTPFTPYSTSQALALPAPSSSSSRMRLGDGSHRARVDLSDQFEEACWSFIWPGNKLLDRRSAITNGFVQMRLATQGLVVTGTAGCRPGSNLCVVVAPTSGIPKSAMLLVEVNGQTVNYIIKMETTEGNVIRRLPPINFPLPSPTTDSSRYGLYVGSSPWDENPTRVRGVVHPAYFLEERGWVISKTPFSLGVLTSDCPRVAL